MAVNTDYKFHDGNEIREMDVERQNNTNELPVLIKIQQAKTLLNKYDIKKTGKNNFHKYNYLELSDITQPILEIFDQLALVHKFTFHPTDSNVACLTITDINTGSNTTYYFHCPPTLDDGSKGMQTKGGIQTYARRYLWQQALDIAIPDTIDSKKNTSRTPSSSNLTDSKENFTQQGTKIMEGLEKKGIKITPDNIKKELLDQHKSGKITADCYNFLIKQKSINT